MASIPLRERARTMRKEGVSINDIALKTGAPKSTVSYWCRDIRLSIKQIEALARKSRMRGRIGALKAAELKRRVRQEATLSSEKLGKNDIGRLSRRDLFMVGLALYWGEGYKNGNEECALTNSDPRIILAFIRWLEQCYKIPRSDLVLRVSLNTEHAKRTSIVESHWAAVTGIPLKQFTRTSLIKARSSKRYRNTDQHFGTLRVKVRRATVLRRRIIGSIAEVGRIMSTSYSQGNVD